MKSITLAAAAVFGLFAAQNASAQCVYDTITPATVANYYTGPGFSPAGEIFAVPTPGSTFSQIDAIYVVDIPGTYTVDVEFRNTYTPLNQINAGLPVLATNGTFTFAAPGVYQLSFPVPCTAVGPTFQTLTFYQPVPGCYIAADDVATVAGTSFNGFSLDAGTVNGFLRPAAAPAGEGEYYQFGAPVVQWNQLISLCGPCIVPPVGTDSLCGSVEAYATKLSDKLPAKLVKELDVRVNNSL